MPWLLQAVLAGHAISDALQAEIKDLEEQWCVGGCALAPRLLALSLPCIIAPAAPAARCIAAIRLLIRTGPSYPLLCHDLQRALCSFCVALPDDTRSTTRGLCCCVKCVLPQGCSAGRGCGTRDRPAPHFATGVMVGKGGGTGSARAEQAAAGVGQGLCGVSHGPQRCVGLRFMGP